MFEMCLNLGESLEFLVLHMWFEREVYEGNCLCLFLRD